MSTDHTAAAVALASRHDGIVLRSELRQLGLSRAAVQRRVGSGVFRPYGRAALVLAGTADDLLTRSRVAARVVPGGVLTGPSAAALTGKGPWEEIDLGTTPWLISPQRAAHARYLAHLGVRIRRERTYLIAHTPHAIVDMLRFLPLEQAQTLAYRSMQTHVVDVPFLLESRERLRRCAGTRQLAEIISDLASGAHSDAERRLIELLRESGITGWVPNYPIPLPGGGIVADVAFPDVRVIVEVDGRAYHSSARRFEGDRIRQNRLVSAGWTVLRFTWKQLQSDPVGVIERLVGVLERASRR